MLTGALGLAGFTIAAISACDQGTQHNQPIFDTYVSILYANVGPQTPLPQNGVIQVHFDRFLHPGTITRQSFLLIDEMSQPVQGALINYDPVSLTVTISNPTTAASGSDPSQPWLMAGQSYKLVMPVPENSTDPNGLRAFDGATLDPAIDHTIGFAVSNQTIPDPRPPHINFCNDVMPVLATKCGTGTPCHTPSPGDGTSDPAASLVLTTPSGIHDTAIGRIAQGSNTSGVSGQTVGPGRIFGVNYPIIAPLNAATSWLMYKVNLAPLPDNSGVTDGPQTCAPPPATITNLPIAPFDPGNDERALLSDAILGKQMPYPSYSTTVTYATNPLTFEERERIRLWIDQGATVDPCATCQ